jgi:hypothetical protein
MGEYGTAISVLYLSVKKKINEMCAADIWTTSFAIPPPLCIKEKIQLIKSYT